MPRAIADSEDEEEISLEDGEGEKPSQASTVTGAIEFANQFLSGSLEEASNEWSSLSTGKCMI